MIEVRYPRICDRSTLAELGRVHPISMSVTENSEPLSTANMQVLTSDMILSPGQFAEICDAYGSIGYYRIMHLTQKYRRGLVQDAEMEHAIVTLSDGLIFGALEFASGQQNAKTVLQNILNRQPKKYWQLWDDQSTASDIAYLTSQTGAFYFEGQDLLEALLDFMAQLPDETELAFDMSTFPWKLIPKRIPTSPICEARLSRNIDELSIAYDFEQLCTRLYPKSGSGDGAITIVGAAGNSGGHEYLDSDTQSTWGIVAKLWTDSESKTSDTLYTKAVKQLEKVKNPVLSITLDGQDLASITGESLDRFTVGQLLRIAIPEDDVNISARILSKQYKNLIQEPNSVTLSIGTKDRRKASKQKSTSSKGGGGGGGRKAKTETLLATISKYGGDTGGQTTFSLSSSDWSKITKVTASIDQDSGSYAFDLYADGNYVAGISGTQNVNLTSYLNQSSGGVATGSHTLRIANALAMVSYTVRFYLTITGYE